jgi:hypothetical protein
LILHARQYAVALTAHPRTSNLPHWLRSAVRLKFTWRGNSRNRERQGHLRPQRPAALQDKTAGRAELPRYLRT